MNQKVNIKSIILILFLCFFVACKMFKMAIIDEPEQSHCLERHIDQCSLLYMIHDNSRWEFYGITHSCFQDIVRYISKPTGHHPSWIRSSPDYSYLFYNSYSMGRSVYKDDLAIWNNYYGCVENIKRMPPDTGGYHYQDSILLSVRRHSELMKPFEYFIGEEEERKKGISGLLNKMLFWRSTDCASLDLRDAWKPKETNKYSECPMINLGRSNAVLRENIVDSIGVGRLIIMEIGTYEINGNLLILKFSEGQDTLILHNCDPERLIISGFSCTDDTVTYVRPPPMKY